MFSTVNKRIPSVSQAVAEERERESRILVPSLKPAINHSRVKDVRVR